MLEKIFLDPNLSISIALGAGIIAQTLAYHMKVPGIVLLLLTGILLGPDIAGIIQPDSLHGSLNIITGFAVGIILFEGGMNLDFSRIKKEQKAIQYLVFAGSISTAAAAAVAAKYIMDWQWKIAIIFGTLVMVTGPTVINPLLKRLKVKRPIATILEAEGVLVDAFGAVMASVIFEAALTSFNEPPLVWTAHLLSKLGTGGILGTITGFGLVYIFRKKNVVPEEIENVFTLCIVISLFQISNAISEESGIIAVTIAGIIMGNFNTHILHPLMEFKESLTIMLIGMLFVLLAADVRLTDITGLGIKGVFVVICLIAVIRPLSVFLSTAPSKLKWKEKIFISWIGPRGIVAAAVASFFAYQMETKGIAGGAELRALVFLVITATVIFSGLTGGAAAKVLGLRRPSQTGFVILGANEVARSMAKILKESGHEVVCIDSNIDHCREAENDCTKVIYGNGLESRYLLRSEIDTRLGAIALTSNDEANYIFIQKVKNEIKNINLYLTLKKNSRTISKQTIHNEKASVMFAAPIDIDFWAVRLKKNQVRLQIFEYMEKQEVSIDSLVEILPNEIFIAAFSRKDTCMPAGDGIVIRQKDKLFIFVHQESTKESEELFNKNGFERISSRDEEIFSTSMCLIPNRSETK